MTAASSLRPQGRCKKREQQGRTEKPRSHVLIMALACTGKQSQSCKSSGVQVILRGRRIRERCQSLLRNAFGNVEHLNNSMLAAPSSLRNHPSGLKTLACKEHGMKIAFLGLGNMGSPMAGHLIAAGHEVKVWNRSLE